MAQICVVHLRADHVSLAEIRRAFAEACGACGAVQELLDLVQDLAAHNPTAADLNELKRLVSELNSNVIAAQIWLASYETTAKKLRQLAAWAQKDLETAERTSKALTNLIEAAKASAPEYGRLASFKDMASQADS